MNKKISGFVKLIRPELPFAAGVCVLLGEIIVLGGFPSLREAVLGFVCGFCISGSAIILNDYFDLEVDKVNALQRPLPSGLVTPFEAVIFTVLTICVGLAAAFAIGVPALILCCVSCLVSFVYNWKFKEVGLVGNLMVSASVGSTFILGGMAAGEPFNKIVWCFALMAFFIDLGEEIAGDAMDMEGDKKRNSKSIAILYGRKTALALSALSFGFAVLVGLVPVVLKWLGISYTIMIIAIDMVILLFTVSLLRSKTPQEGRRAMRVIYMGALFAMLAFLVGKVFA